MIENAVRTRDYTLLWKILFSSKLLIDLTLSGVFYFQTSLTVLWRLSFVIMSVAIFLLINYYYLGRRDRKKKWLIHVLILDFLLSASYGYVYIAGNFPNHLFIGITALGILMLVKNLRMQIAACVLLLIVYLAAMGSIDWYLYQELDLVSYFISCSFIIFAGIVSSLIQVYQRSRQETMQLYTQLMESHVQLQNYALKAEEWAAARERIRIARDIHDTVGHKLTALLVQMQAARKLSVVDPGRSEQTYLECEALVRSSLQEVRLSVRAIRDEPFKSASLNDSLRKLAEEFTRLAEVQTVVEVYGNPKPMPADLQLTAYRITQESLTNAQKHGQAKHAKISLTYAPTGLSLCIYNDGEIPAELKPGFGLINLQERVKECNGEVRFSVDGHEGFAVEVQLPYSLTEMERVLN
ncbi:sensor histidine kinase [Paenibacillus sp. YPG26]|uniref:sensor histidine kinase n=1 Tax=Paenibacillus sp. YPG26 TaxID=2878915 RepID=UPI00203DCC57|nr:sensor histidine kinase [Paenibacillus sp. YPG26]USB32307.1 sensor histidine kinase [Paenibacillus sp. YPG26]